MKLKTILRRHNMKILAALIIIGIFGVVLGVSTSRSKKSSLRFTESLSSSAGEQSEANNLPFTINETYPYTLEAVISRNGAQYYTEGLSFLDSNTLVESAGLYGESGIHKINYKLQKIIQSQSLDKKYFGEGCDFITLANGTKEIYQMTWKEDKVFVFNGEDLSLIRTLNFPSEIAEGWGLVKHNQTVDGVEREMFLVTEGSNRIFLVEPNNFTVLKSHQISYNGQPLNMLNELEIVNGKLWANIYLQSSVAEINMDTWTVERIIDFTDIKNYAKQHFTADIWDSGYCLNGIAYWEGDSESNSKIVLTGKKWDYFFEIKMK